MPKAPFLEVEIDMVMMENGYSLSEVKGIRHLPREWTKKAIYSHYERFIQGECEKIENTKQK